MFLTHILMFRRPTQEALILRLVIFDSESMLCSIKSLTASDAKTPATPMETTPHPAPAAGKKAEPRSYL